jgi:hypothetical protein
VGIGRAGNDGVRHAAETLLGAPNSDSSFDLGFGSHWSILLV